MKKLWYIIRNWFRKNKGYAIKVQCFIAGSDEHALESKTKIIHSQREVILFLASLGKSEINIAELNNTKNPYIHTVIENEVIIKYIVQKLQS